MACRCVATVADRVFALVLPRFHLMVTLPEWMDLHALGISSQPGRQKEDWENIYVYGMFGGMALFTILYMYKPDTTVQTWALAEAVSWTWSAHSLWDVN